MWGAKPLFFSNNTKSGECEGAIYSLNITKWGLLPCYTPKTKNNRAQKARLRDFMKDLWYMWINIR